MGLTGIPFGFIFIKYSGVEQGFILPLILMTGSFLLPVLLQVSQRTRLVIPPRFQASFEINQLEAGRLFLQRSLQESTQYRVKIRFDEGSSQDRYPFPKDIIIPAPVTLHHEPIKHVLLAAIAYYNEQARAQFPIHTSPVETDMTFKWMMGPVPTMRGFRALEAETFQVENLTFRPSTFNAPNGQLMSIQLTELVVYRSLEVIEDDRPHNSPSIRIVA